MKKVAYILTSILLWLIFVFIFAVILILIGVYTFEYNWGYSLGGGMARPQIWLISIGFVLLLRPYIYKLIYKSNKCFKKSIAIGCIILGFIWFAMNTGAKMFSDWTSKQVIEKYQPSQAIEDAPKSVSKIYTKKELAQIEESFIKFAIQTYRQLPIQVDEVTRWNAIVYTSWNMVYTYTVDIDINDYEVTDIEAFLKEIKDSQKEQVPQMVEQEYGIPMEDFLALCKQTGLTFRFGYYDRNNQKLGINILDYSDF